MLALSLLLALPMTISAAGMGVYVPIGVANSSSVSGDYYTRTVDKDYEPAIGLGLAFDSNIGKNKLVNYRLGVEYMNVNVDNVNGWSGTTQEYSRFNIVNTLGFGVLRTKVIRLWVGPRLNIAWNASSDNTYGSDYNEIALELGIAPAVGVNINLGRVVSLGFDVDYRFAALYGAWSTTLDDDTYSGSATGPTARAYVLFRFGETYDKPAPKPVNSGVVDQSL